MKHDMMFFQVMRSKYDQFGGRAGRREFWLFWLVNAILLAVATVVDGFLFPDLDLWEAGPVWSIYGLATIVPVLALGARRLHDTGRSGWLQLLMLAWPLLYGIVPVAGAFAWLGLDVEAAIFGTLALVFLITALVGTVILFVFSVMPGDESENAYGVTGESPDRPAVYWTVLTSSYARFTGRAGRTEFWLYTLVSLLVVLGIAGLLDGWLFPDLFGDDNDNGPIRTIIGLATVVPALAVGARRLHDTGRSGWWQLLILLPIIGWIILFIWQVTASAEGENSHGEPPVTPA